MGFDGDQVDRVKSILVWGSPRNDKNWVSCNSKSNLNPYKDI